MGLAPSAKNGRCVKFLGGRARAPNHTWKQRVWGGGQSGGALAGRLQAHTQTQTNVSWKRATKYSARFLSPCGAPQSSHPVCLCTGACMHMHAGACTGRAMHPHAVQHRRRRPPRAPAPPKRPSTTPMTTPTAHAILSCQPAIPARAPRRPRRCAATRGARAGPRPGPHPPTRPRRAPRAAPAPLPHRLAWMCAAAAARIEIFFAAAVDGRACLLD